MSIDIKHVVLLILVAAAGCAGPAHRLEFSSRTLESVPFGRAFDETEIAVDRHFDVRYADRKSGVMATRYSSEKSIDGIIKIRAIAALTPSANGQSTTVHLKIVRERFWEKWQFDHELTTQIDFEGYDRRLANAILDEIQASASR